jgi:hypothetical protein
MAVVGGAGRDGEIARAGKRRAVRVETPSLDLGAARTVVFPDDQVAAIGQFGDRGVLLISGSDRIDASFGPKPGNGPSGGPSTCDCTEPETFSKRGACALAAAYRLKMPGTGRWTSRSAGMSFNVNGYFALTFL